VIATRPKLRPQVPQVKRQARLSRLDRSTPATIYSEEQSPLLDAEKFPTEILAYVSTTPGVTRLVAWDRRNAIFTPSKCLKKRRASEALEPVGLTILARCIENDANWALTGV
jgi:hypothetical protein